MERSVVTAWVDISLEEKAIEMYIGIVMVFQNTKTFTGTVLSVINVETGGTAISNMMTRRFLGRSLFVPNMGHLSTA